MDDLQLKPAPSQAWYALRLVREHFVDCLYEYEDKIAQYQELANKAREQIVHAEALLETLEPVSPIAEGVLQPYIAEQFSSSKEIVDSEVERIEVLPQWQGCTRLEAISQIFQQNRGKVLHPEFILHQLYGEVNSEHKKTLLMRIKERLNEGKHKKLWIKVDNSGGCYASDKNAIAS